MNYFIEGIQGTGKSTLLRKIQGSNPNLSVFYEGDVSPLVPAWCAYLKKEDREYVKKTYSELWKEIEEKTIQDEEYAILSYTRILTDIPNFHRDLERFSFYQGRVNFDEFKRYIKKRFYEWKEENQAFEATFFQNIIETLLLFYEKTEEEILLFYGELKEALEGKKYQIIYLDSKDLKKTIEAVKRERVDLKGEEIWFPLVIRYLESSPYGKRHGLKGWEGLLFHLERRRSLEKRILEEIFPGEGFVVSEKVQPDEIRFFERKGKI